MTLHPYTSEMSKTQGSRLRILNAAKMCCSEQGILTLCNLEDAYFTVSELHWYADNDVIVIMKRNLPAPIYEQFLTLAWGENLTSQFANNSRGATCPSEWLPNKEALMWQ